MENFIVILKNGDIKHGSGYTPMLRRMVDEGKVKKVINVSNPTEPRELISQGKKGTVWVKLHVVG